MVNNKIAQRAVAAGLSGLMAFGAAAPAALAFSWKTFEWRSVDSNDNSTFWKRLAGDTRYGTMKKIVDSYNQHFEALNDINRILFGTGSREVYNYHSTAVLASGDNFPDALAANGLAGYMTNEGLGNNAGSNASVPVIITKSNSLVTEAKDLLKGMQVQNVIIMGGTAAISQGVEDEINKMGIGTSRLAGKDRQETSLKALQRINGNWEGRKGTYDLIIATGDNYADALSISPYAYRMGTPVLLTKKDGTLTDEQVAAIKANDEIKEIVIVGGTAAVSDTVMGQIGTLKNNRIGVHYTRLAGADRYETSAKIAEFEVASWLDYYNTAWTAIRNTNYSGFNGSMWEMMGFDNGFTLDHAVVATGENFPDALVGGQLAGGVDTLGIDVKDFSGWNAWSPCPLLLVKDGNLMAQNVIASEVGKSFTNWGTSLSSREDLYTSEWRWNEVLGNEYKKTDVTYTTYIDKWYETMKANEIRNGFGVMYINHKMLDNNGALYWNGAVPFNAAGYEQNAELEYMFNNAGDKLEWCKINGQFVNARYATNKVLINGQPDPFDNAIVLESDVAMSDGSIIPTGTLLWQFGQGVGHTTRETAKRQITVWITDARSVSAQIIGWSGRQLDFYGIILGGTNAVSNKTRDDLNSLIDRVARPDNFRLNDTLILNNTTYLNNGVELGVPYHRMSFFRTVTGDIAGLRNVSIDFYTIAGSQHMVARANGQWFFLYNGRSNADAIRLLGN